MVPGTSPLSALHTHFVSAQKSRLNHATGITPGVEDGLMTSPFRGYTIDIDVSELRWTETTVRL